MPEIKGLKEIQIQIASHPGKLAHDEWENLKRTFVHIYQQNRKQLIKYLEEPSRNDKLSIELFQNVRPPKVREAYTNEVLRNLYNYLSSLSALIDQGMRLEKKYIGKLELKDYLEKRETVVSSDINAFFGKLRNYIQHYGTPPLSWTVTLREQTDNECVYYLSKETLLEWDGWDEKARRYIASQPKLNLIESINTHGKMIDDAYEALLHLFPILHGKDIDDLNKLGDRFNKILKGEIKL